MLEKNMHHNKLKQWVMFVTLDFKQIVKAIYSSKLQLYESTHCMEAMLYNISPWIHFSIEKNWGSFNQKPIQ